MGFCTFNGLMVTALALKEEGVKRIGILDLDMHYGNGTDDIIGKLGLTDEILCHFTGGGTTCSPSRLASSSTTAAEGAGQMADCDVVLYQAGRRSARRRSAWRWLTTAELRERDACVFDALRARRKVPVAWNLAGGYQGRDGRITKVLEIHDNTMRECERFFGAS